MTTWETYQAAYQVATEEQKALVDSDLISNGVDQLIILGAIDSAQKRVTMSTCALFALAVITENDFVIALSQAGVPDSTSVVRHLIKHISQNSKEKNLDTITPEAEIVDSIPIPEEQTYNTTQASILQKSSDVPQNQAQPRWGSDQ